jgi:hypothetical protein
MFAMIRKNTIFLVDSRKTCDHFDDELIMAEKNLYGPLAWEV